MPLCMSTNSVISRCMGVHLCWFGILMFSSNCGICVPMNCFWNQQPYPCCFWSHVPAWLLVKRSCAAFGQIFLYCYSSNKPGLLLVNHAFVHSKKLAYLGTEFDKILWPIASNAIWRQRSWSTLDQVMACCLTAPSHYLNQCWLIISKV